MPYGLLTPEMEALLVPHVAGKVVWDLGAGDLGYSKLLVKLGASRVLAVEKERIRQPNHPGIELVLKRFHELDPDHIEVAFLSWPANHSSPGLAHLLSKSDVVIYLGSNTDMSACGTPDLFLHHLCGRELLGHAPHRRNTMLIYGQHDRRTGPLTGEEFAAITGQPLTFEAATAAATKATGHWG